MRPMSKIDRAAVLEELRLLGDELEATNPSLLADLVERLRQLRLGDESNNKLVTKPLTQD